MADISKRVKRARRGAKGARKLAGRQATGAGKLARSRMKDARAMASPPSDRARLLLLLAVAGALIAAIGARKKATGGSEQRHRSEPDHLPNEPDRPAHAEPPPGADTGPATEAERTRAEQRG